MSFTSTEQLEQAIEYALSQPPVTVGCKLRSVQELATRLNIGKSRVQTSLARLERRGVLHRRRKSGTFVRRIPETPRPLQAGSIPKLTPEVLFDGNGSMPPTAQLVETREQLRFQLGLWEDFKKSSLTNQHLLSSIMNAINDRRQRLSVHSVFDMNNQPRSLGEIRQMIADNPSDGYLVVLEQAELFKQALEGATPSITFFSMASVSSWLRAKYQPIVVLDTVSAMEDAVYRLYEQGYERIAFLGYLPTSVHRREYKAYKQALAEVRLTQRYCLQIHSSQSLDAQKAFLAEQLTEDPMPDAFVLTDDHALVAVRDLLQSRGLRPGQDVGVVTLSNKGFDLAEGFLWSTMQFDLEEFAQALVQKMMGQLQSAAPSRNEVAIGATWMPGVTHLRQADRAACEPA